MAKNSMGQFIAALRKENGMTQQEVADLLNVSNKSVSRWECDSCAPDLSLIPSIAELFGVTCDELLKGERAATNVAVQRENESKGKNQLNALLNNSISKFKTLIWISLALSFAGFICMFLISYGFYRPVIGFTVMLLFETAAFVISIISINKLKEVKTNTEYFENVDDSLVEKYNHNLGLYSYVAFFSIVSVILLSLPLVLINSDYVESVLAINSYFFIFFIGISLILTAMFFKCKESYIAWITGNQLYKKEADPIICKTQIMSLLQIGMIVISGLLFVLAPYCETTPHETSPFYTVMVVLGLTCLIGNVVCFIIFLLRNKSYRKDFLLTGIRNVLIIPSALFITECHYSGWHYNEFHSYTEENTVISQYSKYDFWNPEYFIYAICWAVFIIVIFMLMDVFRRKNITKG